MASIEAYAYSTLPTQISRMESVIVTVTVSRLGSLHTPNEGIQRSVKNGLVFGLFCALLGGLLGHLDSGLVGRLVGGLFIGLFAGLLPGPGAAIQHYTLRFWLASSGVFPWRAVPFLEDATARILLRRVGGGYSFAHRLLLDFFADAYARPSSASPAARSILSSPP